MDERLKATMNSTHVCRQWRNIILDSPLIWASLIYVDSSHDGDLAKYPRDTKLLNEILRRSSMAPLTITAIIGILGDGGHSSRAAEGHEYLISVLSNNWYRVERLVIYVHGTNSAQYYHDELIDILSYLQYAAPCLKECSIENVSGRVSYQPQAMYRLNSLFANDAPSLRFLRGNYLTISPTAPWLSSLTTLITTSTTCGIFKTVYETLIMLSRMPRLIHLEIGNNISEMTTSVDPVDKIPFVNLPKLKYFALKSFPTSALTLMEKIQGSGSGFVMNIEMPIKYNTPVLEEVMTALFSQTFEKSANLRHPDGLKWVFIYFYRDQFILADRGCFPYNHSLDFSPQMSPEGVYFSIKFQGTSNDSYVTYIPTVVRIVSTILSSPTFHDVTTLRVQADHTSHLYDIFTTSFGTSYPIDTLEIDILMAVALVRRDKLRIQNRISIPFPNLKTLSVNLFENDPKSMTSLHALNEIMEVRQSMGKRIQTLNLYKCISGVNYVSALGGNFGLRSLRMRLRDKEDEAFEYNFLL